MPNMVNKINGNVSNANRFTVGNGSKTFTTEHVEDNNKSFNNEECFLNGHIGYQNYMFVSSFYGEPNNDVVAYQYFNDHNKTQVTKSKKPSNGWDVYAIANYAFRPCFNYR